MKKIISLGFAIHLALSLSSAPHIMAFTGNAEKLPKECASKAKDFNQALTCAQKYFSVDGQRVNPRIIEDLESLISDSGTQVFAISLLSSQNSNRYYCQDVAKAVTSQNCGIPQAASYNYEVVGKTDSGLFALKTTTSGGGSGLFYNLLLVSIKEAKSIGDVYKLENNMDLTPQPRMILVEKIGSITLGDRTNPDIQVRGNTILIEKCADICGLNPKREKYELTVS